MRRPLAAISLLAVALLLSACAASQAPGWTFAPPTPAPTAGPSSSADASAAASEAPSAEASAGASAAASGGTSGGTVVDIVALNVAFTTMDVTAPAGAPFTIHFDNQDASIQHNVQIKDAGGNIVFDGDLVTGPAKTDYSVPALQAGAYTFVCKVHPNMTGMLKVGS